MKTMSLGLQAYVQASRAAWGVLGWRVGQPAGRGWAGEEARGPMTVNRPTGLEVSSWKAERCQASVRASRG